MTEGQPEEYGEDNVNELVGGIRNAMDRGEDLNKAKQSFFNAGYNKTEIDEATAVLGLSEPIIQPKPIVQALPTKKILPEKETKTIAQPLSNPLPSKSQPSLPTNSPQVLPKNNIVFQTKKETQKLPVAKFEEPKPLNKALVLVLILLGILFVVIAGFLGVFWDQLFGPF